MATSTGDLVSGGSYRPVSFQPGDSPPFVTLGGRSRDFSPDEASPTPLYIPWGDLTPIQHGPHNIGRKKSAAFRESGEMQEEGG